MVYTYTYAINSTVWFLTSDYAVVSGTVKQVDITSKVSETLIIYTIASHGKALKKPQDEIYMTLNDALAALALLLD